MTEAVYLFCLAPPDPPPVVEGMGVDGRNRVFSHVFMDTLAVVSLVCPDEFCGPSAEANMQDLSWIGPRVYRHAEVVEQVMHRSPVLPMPFGTIFSSLESLEERLEKYQGPTGEFLAQAADREEWVVKGFVDRVKAADELLSANLAEQEETLASLPPGLRYFKEKKLKAEIQRQLNSRLKEVCASVAEELSSCAAGFFQRPPPDPGDEADESRQILNWAFWVPKDKMAAFRDGLEAINTEQDRRGLNFEMSGPWPPYSFRPCLENG